MPLKLRIHVQCVNSLVDDGAVTAEDQEEGSPSELKKQRLTLVLPLIWYLHNAQG